VAAAIDSEVEDVVEEVDNLEISVMVAQAVVVVVFDQVVEAAVIDSEEEEVEEDVVEEVEISVVVDVLVAVMQMADMVDETISVVVHAERVGVISVVDSSETEVEGTDLDQDPLPEVVVDFKFYL